MKRDVLLRLLRKRPFQPFRIELADGRAFNIRYPELNILGQTFMAVGIPEQGADDPFAESVEIVMLSDIARAEPSDQGATVPAR